MVPITSPDVTNISKIISDKSRMIMLDLLMDGNAHCVSDLAKAANIKTHTASYHLRKLAEHKIVLMEQKGRFHYYSLFNSEIAEFFEYISNFAPKIKINYLSQSEEHKKITYFRRCYDHMAGKIGVEITDRLKAKGYIDCKDSSFILTAKGENFFENELNINIAKLRNEKRSFSRKCQDWSERKPHLAGSLGKALMNHLLENASIKIDQNSRGIEITSAGKEYLSKFFDLYFK